MRICKSDRWHPLNATASSPLTTSEESAEQIRGSTMEGRSAQHSMEFIHKEEEKENTRRGTYGLLLTQTADALPRAQSPQEV